MVERYETGPAGGAYADRIHWGSIALGVFTALAIFVLSTILAYAIGLGPTYAANRVAGYGTGAIIWGAIAAAIAFAIGGYLAARWARERGSSSSALHGFAVWAVATPILVYVLGAGVSPMLGTSATDTDGVISAVVIPEQGGVTQQTAANADRIHPAWWMLISLLVGLVAATVAGAAAAGGDRGRGRTAGG